MSAQAKKIQESIQKARKAAQELQQQIKTQFDSLDDTKIENAKLAPAVPNPIKVRQKLKGHTNKVYSICWNPQSSSILSTSQDGKLLLWDAITGYKLNAVVLNNPYVMTVAYSPSGSLISCGGLTNTCHVFALKSFQSQALSSQLSEEKIDVNSITVTQKLKDPSSPKSIDDQYMDSFSQPKKVCDLVGHDGYISAIRFISDRNILTSSGDSTCILWDTTQSRIIKKFEGHNADVMALDTCPDCGSSDSNSLFVTGSVDKLVKLWDIKSGKNVATFTGHSSDVNAVSFFPNGMGVGSGCEDGTLKLFDFRAARELQEYKLDHYNTLEERGVTSCSFSKSGRYLFASLDGKRITMFETISGKAVQHLTDHDKRVSCVAVSPDGNGLASCGFDGQILIYA